LCSVCANCALPSVVHTSKRIVNPSSLNLNMIFSAGSLHERNPPCHGLKRWKAQESQTAIQQSLIDINVVEQELLEGSPKIGQIPP
jgi:hypothetical protein